MFRRDFLQNKIKSFRQFHRCQKNFSLELLFDKLPNSFNCTLGGGYELVDLPGIKLSGP